MGKESGHDRVGKEGGYEGGYKWVGMRVGTKGWI